MDWRPYQYQKLREHQAIRVIKLLPAPNHEDEIQCRLVHTTITNCTFDIGNYIALSYVWGNAEDTVPIIVENQPLLVTANLDSALRHIRESKRVVNIWADAISINQTDDEEKSQQVRQMGKVYKNAYLTIIYVGEGTDKSDNLFSWMNDRSKDRQKIDVDLSLAADILERPWFGRVWTFQELILSKDSWVQGEIAMTRSISLRIPL